MKTAPCRLFSFSSMMLSTLIGAPIGCEGPCDNTIDDEGRAPYPAGLFEGYYVERKREIDASTQRLIKAIESYEVDLGGEAVVVTVTTAAGGRYEVVYDVVNTRGFMPAN